MFDELLDQTNQFMDRTTPVSTVAGNGFFWAAKRLFDIVISIALIPGMLLLIVILLILNPFLNRGPLFFMQERMGYDCKPFRALKFRTMTHVDEIVRGHDDPIETDRITRLGMFFRKARLDEIPQIINALKGDMSLIGPRPDYYAHAEVFAREIPGYKARHLVKPGISGLAQVSLGYAEGMDATRAKTNADQYYISNAGFKLDTKIALKTLFTVLFRDGA